MFYINFDFSFKKLDSGHYAYFPYVPWIPKAYVVSEEERRKILTVRTSQMTLIASFGALASLLATLDGNIAVLTAIIGCLLVPLGWGYLNVKKLLEGKKLERIENISYAQYLKQLAISFNRRDYFVVFRSIIFCLVVGAWVTYDANQHSQLGLSVLGICFLVAGVILTFYGSFCVIYRFLHQAGAKIGNLH